jgi:hypothetical protein
MPTVQRFSTRRSEITVGPSLETTRPHPKFTHIDLFEANMAIAIKPHMNATNNRHIQVGEWHLECFRRTDDFRRAVQMATQSQALPQRRHSDGRAHLFVEGQMPQPTDADVDHVNAEDGTLPGSRWVFERTLYQNEHQPVGQNHAQRIVHLFALIDAQGQIDRVRVASGCRTSS